MITPEDQITPKPDWYKKDGVADIERTMLPEWFNGSAPHRTPESYLKARETILAISDTVSNRNVTSSMVRRSIVGDAGSLHRLREFMSNWGLINEDAINDSAPTAPLLREKYPVAKQFDDKLRNELINAVVEQSNKRQKTASDNSFVPIDWEEIALQVGSGATSTDCERNFLSMPINVEESAPTDPNTEKPPITPEVSQVLQKAFSEPTKDAARQDFLRELVDSCDPTMVRKVTGAALEVVTKEPGNLKEAQSGALLGLVATRAVEEAQKSEKQLESILSQLLDQRMKKLENRMVMMDDVESILEAEKVALELERRDLYTARCRHWFGGG
jgi:SWI/SNF related-matrix-associated actin-dependent regulator of chromatin subfamily C